ncbi:hypothetical protein ACROYT_G015693 [Oculina patagonica]
METSKSSTSTDPSRDDKTHEKRRPRCSGCKLSHEIHKLSLPGPHCTGPVSTLLGSPKKDLMASKLLAWLDELQVEEAALQKQRRSQRLKAIIAETKKWVSSLKSTTITQVPSPASGGMSAMLNSAYTASQATAKTPLDNLLVGSGNGVERNKQNISSFTLGPGTSPDGPLMPPQAVQESLMFLKPSQANKGERVLRIIDFIDKLVPNTDEHTISEVGSTKLLVSFGTKKPKLDSISLAQWVIGNTRIFHTLLQLELFSRVLLNSKYLNKISDRDIELPKAINGKTKFQDLEVATEFLWKTERLQLPTIIDHDKGKPVKKNTHLKKVKKTKEKKTAPPRRVVATSELESGDEEAEIKKTEKKGTT